MAEKDKTITILVSTAVILILAVALISSIATESLNRTTKTAVINEAISITTARTPLGKINMTPLYITKIPSGWQSVERCDLELVSYGNLSTAWTENTDFTFSTTNGTIYVRDTVVVNGTIAAGFPTNQTQISYRYCQNEYLNSSWGRTILNLTPGIIAIAILVIAVLAAYSLLGKREED